MRNVRHSIRLVTICAVLFGGALGLTITNIDWPAPTPSVQASGTGGSIDWP
jgi:hypothetical protein